MGGDLPIKEHMHQSQILSEMTQVVETWRDFGKSEMLSRTHGLVTAWLYGIRRTPQCQL
jgi:hypothetical protein